MRTTPVRSPVEKQESRNRLVQLLLRRQPSLTPSLPRPTHLRRARQSSNNLPMAKPLAGKIALVTGAAKRIGRSIALALAENGAEVAITYLGSQLEAERTVRDLAGCDVDALAVRCDLRDPVAIEEAVVAVVEEFGRLDILVNNAGVFESA